MIYGYRGLTPPKRLLTLISHGEAAGVIFFSDNISSKAQLRRVVHTLERANANSKNPVRAPLLLMIDQEGGKVRRLPGAPLLSERDIGRSSDPFAAASRAGTDAGRNLRSIGLNVNLAPVLDVYRTAGNFDDRYGRSYSKDSRVVADAGVAFIRAQQRERVAATAKHFPGLGTAATSQDTDKGSVTLGVSRESLSQVDVPPFEAAIAARVKLMMVSWAVYPALDPTAPAGFSPTIVSGYLRDDLGFKGVTVSDGLLADALLGYRGTRHRAVLAARAGMDLLICAKLRSTPAVGVNARNALQAGYTDGTLNRSTFEASARRVIALRRSLGN